MENYVREFHHQKDVFSLFHASKSTKKVSDALEQQLTLDEQEVWESDPLRGNLSVAVKPYTIDVYKMQMKSDIAQHILNKSDFNYVKMHLVNHFTDYIRQCVQPLQFKLWTARKSDDGF